MKDKLIGVGMVILFAPLILAVLLFALPILLGDFLYSKYRKEPKPKVPKTVEIDALSDSELANRCLKFISDQLSDLGYTVKQSEDSCTIASNAIDSKPVTFGFGAVFNIDIADVNTYEWYIDDNHRDIDLYLWIVIGVLRGGVKKARSRLGRENYWVWSDELGVWVVLQKEGTSYDGIHFYSSPPPHIKKQFSEL
jgi:hypothetical protein